MDARRNRPRLLISSFDLEKQLRRLAESTLGADRGRWPYRGLTTAFPLLSDRIDGIKNGVYALASAARMGKTTFALQLAFDVLQRNAEARVLFVSLDQPAREINIRLVAMAGECKTDYVQNPTAEAAEKYDARRQKGLAGALRLKERLTIVDESMGALSLGDLVSFVRQARGRVRRPVLLFLDPYYKLRGDRPGGHASPFSEQLMGDLKTLATSEDVGVVVTTRLAQGAGARRPTLEDLEDQPAILYDSHVVMLLYCDSFSKGDTEFMEWEWGTDDLMVPIFELFVAKNKTGAFAGRLWYKFYASFSKFKECSEVEIDNYNRLLKNLRVHDRKDPEVDESSPARIEDIDAAGS
jgi:replicative DNA helicase